MVEKCLILKAFYKKWKQSRLCNSYIEHPSAAQVMCGAHAVSPRALVMSRKEHWQSDKRADGWRRISQTRKLAVSSRALNDVGFGEGHVRSTLFTSIDEQAKLSNRTTTQR